MARIKLEKTLHIGAWLIMLAYFLPYLILGEDISITIHDNLDSNLVWLKLIFENTTLTSPNDTLIPNIMNGVSMSSLAPVYDLQYFTFNTFGIFNGYIAIRFAMLIIGFYGMRALLSNHVFNDIKQRSSNDGHRAADIKQNPEGPANAGKTQYPQLNTHNSILTTQYSILNTHNSILITITYGVSLCFALLPHWGYNLSIATLPIIFNALLNIQMNKANKWDYLAIAFVGVTSSLILVGMFVLVGFGLFGLLELFTKRKSPWPLYGGLILLSCTYILTHSRLFVAILNPAGSVSHRTEFDLLFDWPGLIFSRANQLLTDGWYHAASIHQLFLFVIPVALFLIWKKTKDYKFINGIEFIIISCLWYSLVNWSGTLPITSLITNIVPIQLQRLHFIQPLVWYVLFALSLFYLVKHIRWGKIAAPLLILTQIIILFFHHEGITQRDQPSYKAFYATALFDDVKTFLGPEESQERCIFISSHPAILQYNGFYTLDGYLADYPLSYKHAFGEIIQGELDKNPTLNRGFTRWGSRAYAMVAQLGKNFMHPKSNNDPSPRGEGLGEGAQQASNLRTITSIDYNWQAFTDMGGKYIFSPLPINDPNLKHLKTFDHPDAAWTIYLYVLAEGTK